MAGEDGVGRDFNLEKISLEEGQSGLIDVVLITSSKIIYWFWLNLYLFWM